VGSIFISTCRLGTVFFPVSQSRGEFSTNSDPATSVAQTDSAKRDDGASALAVAVLTGAGERTDGQNTIDRTGMQTNCVRPGGCRPIGGAGG